MNTTTLQGLWATRPLRRRSGHKIAGVCSGIGARYNVDPTLIRVLFVVAAIFGGSGLLLYLVAVFALPSDRTRAADGGKRDDSMSFPKLAVLAILAIVVVSSFGGDHIWSGSGLLGTVLLLAGWWLLYLRTPVAPAGTSVADQPAAPTVDGSAAGVPIDESRRAETPAAQTPAAQTPASVSAETVAEPAAPGEPDQPAPPAWDPLGVAPFAWDLPNPPPAPEPPAPVAERSPVTPVTAGIALLVAMAGIALQLTGADWFTTSRIAAATLVVIGIGLIVGGLQRRRDGERATGLVWLGAIVAGVVIVSSLMNASGWNAPSGGVGDREWRVSSQSQLADKYSLTVGSSTLDLRELGAIDRDQTVTVRQGVGEMIIRLPENVRVRAECGVGIGDYTCPSGIVGGPADGPVLTIDAHVGMGNVEMKR